MRILDRYVLKETLGPFFVGVVGFILVLTVDLLFTMADLIINKGVPLLTVLKLLVYKLPSLLVLTFPVSTLFGTAMALGRFGKDNELTALRTSGVSITRIALPILALGLVVSLISFVTNERVVPHANRVSNNIIRQVIYKQPLPEVKDNVFFKDQQNRYYYARRVDLKTRQMENLMVYELTDEKYPRVIIADDILNFTQQKDVTDMDRGELTSLITALGKGGVNTASMLTELYLRYSIPFTCFVFALVGIPFSLSGPRTGQTWGLVVTIVFMFTFYVFASVFRSLGRGGVLPPSLAAFTPQVSFALIGLALLFRESKFH